MTRLDQLMRDAVAHTPTDTERLATAARARGASLRRRRRATLAGGAVGVVAAVAGVALVAPLPGTDPSPGDTVASSGAAQSPTTGDAPLTGRSTAALLRDIVEGSTGGTTTDYAGQGDASRPGMPDTYAELELTVPQHGIAVTGVNVQDASIMDGEDRGCSAGMADCRSVQLPDGAALLLYTDVSEPQPAGSESRVAELQREDLRVVARTTGDRVLTDAELRGLVTDERWGFRVDAELVEAGRSLTPYDDLDAVVDTGTPQPRGEAPLAPTPAPTR